MSQFCTSLLLTGFLSLATSGPATAESRRKAEPTRTDTHGDPLPPGALARMGTIRFRQGSNVESVVYSPDGQVLASGGETVCLWHVATGKPLHRLTFSQFHGGGLAFSPDGRTLATAGEGLCLWDVATGKQLRQMKESNDAWILSVSFSSDGKIMASGNRNGGVLLW